MYCILRRLAVYKAQQQKETHMAFNRTAMSSGTRRHKEQVRQQNLELVKFPKGVEIRYKGKDPASLGTVIKHDLVQGRLETNRRGSHNPFDVEIIPTEK